MADNFNILEEDWSRLDSWLVFSGRDNLQVVGQDLVVEVADEPTSLLAVAHGGNGSYSLTGSNNSLVLVYTLDFTKAGEGNIHFRIPLFEYARQVNADRTPEFIFDGSGLVVFGSSVQFGTFSGSRIAGSSFTFRVNATYNTFRVVVTNGADTLDSGDVSDLAYMLGEPKQHGSSLSLYPMGFSFFKDTPTVSGNVTVSPIKAYMGVDSTEITTLLGGGTLTLLKCPNPSIALSSNDAPAGTIVTATITLPGVLNSNRRVRYTTDGSDPRTSPSRWVNLGMQLQITKSCTLRVVAGTSENNVTQLSDVVSQEIRIGVGVAGTYVKRPRILPENGCANVGNVHLCTIDCETPDASIYYTVDGSAPSNASTPYIGPFVVTNANVQAIAYKAGLTPSEVSFRKFMVGPQELLDAFADTDNWIHSGNASVSGGALVVNDPTGTGVRLKRERTASRMCISFTVNGPFRFRTRNSALEVSWKPDVNDSNTYKFGVWRGATFISGHVLASNAGSTDIHLSYLTFVQATVAFLTCGSSRNAGKFDIYGGGTTPSNNGPEVTDEDIEFEFTSEGVATFEVTNWRTILNVYEAQSNQVTYHNLFVSSRGVGLICSPPVLSAPSGLVTIGQTITVSLPPEASTGSCFIVDQNGSETNLASFTIEYHNQNVLIGYRSGFFTSFVRALYRTASGADKYGMTHFKQIGTSITPPEGLDSQVLNVGKYIWQYDKYNVTQGYTAISSTLHDSEIVRDELLYLDSDIDDESNVVCEYRVKLNRNTSDLCLAFLFGEATQAPGFKFKVNLNNNRYHAYLKGSQGSLDLQTSEHIDEVSYSIGADYLYATGFYSQESLNSDFHVIRVARRFSSGQLQCKAQFYHPTKNTAYGIKVPWFQTPWFNCNSSINARPKIVVLSNHTQIGLNQSQFRLYSFKMWKNVLVGEIDNLLKYGTKTQPSALSISYNKSLSNLSYGEAVTATITPTQDCRLYAVHSEDVSDDPLLQTRHAYLDNALPYFDASASPGSPANLALVAPFKLNVRAIYLDTALDNPQVDSNTSRFYTPTDIQTISGDVDPSSILEVVDSIAGEVTLRVKQAQLGNSTDSFFEFDDGLRNWRTTYQSTGYNIIKRKLSPGDHGIKLSRWGTTNQRTYWSKGSTMTLPFQVPDKLRCLFSTSSSVVNVGTSVTFTGSSFGGSGAKTYVWDFGDGNTSTLQSPTHTYANPGIYTVKLYVTDENGDSDSLAKYNAVTVQQAPISNATPTLVRTTRIS